METMNVVAVRQSFSEVMARVAYTGQRVVIERKGRPMMALVSIEDLHRLEEWEQGGQSTRMRRAAALALATAARARIRAERQGASLPDSADILERLREERLHELTDLRCPSGHDDVAAHPRGPGGAGFVHHQCWPL